MKYWNSCSLKIYVLDHPFNKLNDCLFKAVPCQFGAACPLVGLPQYCRFCSAVSMEAYQQTLFALLIKFPLCSKWGHIHYWCNVSLMYNKGKAESKNLYWNNQLYHCLSADLYVEEHHHGETQRHSLGVLLLQFCRQLGLMSASTISSGDWKKTTIL